MFADDSVFEETIIAEYALVINGHSLVSELYLLFTCFVFVLGLAPAGFMLLTVIVLLSTESGISVPAADCGVCNE